MSESPCVSIGLAVYNGEKYLKKALDSIITQTFTDLELIISDNFSTDNTQQICEQYASQDERIRYYRNNKNIGAPRNFNRAFELASGKYFKWAASDDVLAPDFLRKCVAILDKDASVVLCHSITGRIDENGDLLGFYNKGGLGRIDSKKSHERFGDLIRLNFAVSPIFGVIRADSFRKTSLHGEYIGADRNLLAEIGLLGRIHLIPECLFFEREHSGAYSTTFYGKNKSTTPYDRLRKESAWWTTENPTSFPHWKNYSEYFNSVRRIKLSPSERILCYDQIFRALKIEGWKYVWCDMKDFLLYNSEAARTLIPFATNIATNVHKAIKI